MCQRITKDFTKEEREGKNLQMNMSERGQKCIYFTSLGHNFVGSEKKTGMN